jgi:hypothetical protein
VFLWSTPIFLVVQGVTVGNALAASLALSVPGGLLFERDITVSDDTPRVKVPLDSGSIRGRFRATVARIGTPRGEIIAVPGAGQGPIRRTSCDDEGNYCLRYLHPGLYTLFARFADEGWARVDNIKVASNVTDLGERPLTRGEQYAVPSPSAGPVRHRTRSSPRGPLGFR